MLESFDLEILKECAKELQEISTPWDFANDNSEVLDDLIRRMKITMRSEGGIGLSAPQVGVNKRLFVIEVRGNERYGNLPNVPFEVFFLLFYGLKGEPVTLLRDAFRWIILGL